ncbi:MAG: hypothetical protein R2709_15260 [Marmoricola sp.]
MTLENDANAALCAEWRFGAARGRDHVLLVTVGTDRWRAHEFGALCKYQWHGG